MKASTTYHIEPQTGAGLALNRGQFLRIIDPEGEQVADLMAFNHLDTTERLSSGRTLDYNGTIFLTKGHVLYSNRSRLMFTIVEDTVGRLGITACAAGLSNNYQCTAINVEVF